MLEVKQYDIKEIETLLVGTWGFPKALAEVIGAYDSQVCGECKTRNRLTKKLPCSNISCRKSSKPLLGLACSLEVKEILSAFQEDPAMIIYEPSKLRDQYTTPGERIKYHEAARQADLQSFSINSGQVEVYKCFTHNKVARNFQGCDFCDDCTCPLSRSDGDTCKVREVFIRPRRLIIVRPGTRLTSQEAHKLLKPRVLVVTK